jgi:hypothetical protein
MFGFSIYKFSQLDGLGWAQQVPLIGTRAFALMLMSIRLISLPLATTEHRQNIRALSAQCAFISDSMLPENKRG